MFVILWEFEVKQLSKERFERVYGPDGPWAQLFRSDPRYRRTSLLSDTSRPDVYYTLDFWDSASAFEHFKRANREAYHSLDRSSEGLTLSERFLGAFTPPDPPHPGS